VSLELGSMPPVEWSEAIDAIEGRAPDIVAAWRGIEADAVPTVRREVRRRAGAGSAPRIVAQLDGLADALVAIIEQLPAEAFGRAGGEADWTVAEAIGHVATARAGLVLSASLAASGRWPADAPAVIPGVPGPSVERVDLIRKVEQSRRLIDRVGRRIEGHETEPCPLEHPLVGRLRCGEWLVFAGVHDLMHLEQLHAIAASMGAGVGE
jgi:DinB superfamily